MEEADYEAYGNVCGGLDRAGGASPPRGPRRSGTRSAGRPTPQTFDAAVNRLIGGAADFNKEEANGVVQAAIQSYCEGHQNLIHG
jgi:hypothetical protein